MERSTRSVRSSLLHEDQIFGTRSQEPGDAPCRFANARFRAPRRRLMSGELAEHESGWLALDFVAQRLLLLEDTPGRRAHRPVIEVRVFGIEQPVLPHRMTECSHAADSSRVLKNAGSVPGFLGR